MAGERAAIDAIPTPFDVPEDWTTPQLSDHCEFVRDGDWIESKDQGGNDFRLLQISNIGVGRFVETGNFRWITEDTFKRLNCTEIVSGDVLVARMPDPTGRAWRANALSWRAVTAVDVAIVRTRPDELDPQFLACFLNSPQCLALVHGLTTGTTRLRIRRADIERLCVPLPRLPEQRAIAHILGTLDERIELNRRINGTLEAIAQALFKSWFVDFDAVRAKAEGRDPGLPQLLADLFPDSFEDSELGEIPRGWSATPLYGIATYINGAAYAAFQPNDERRGLPIIKIAELKAGVTAQTKFSDVRMPEKYRIADGDILFSWSGNPDTSIDTFVWSGGPAWLNQHVFRVLPRHPHERAFVLSTLKALQPIFAEIARNKQTTGLGHVTAEDMKRLLVARPDDRVMFAWSKLASPLHERTFQNSLEIRMLSKIREAVLPKLISGELRVEDPARFSGCVA